MGRGQAQTVLTRLGDVLDKLADVRAPKSLVLFSGGIPFDVDLLSRYRDLATKAARARVAIFIVHVDQAGFDASDRTSVETVFGGREYTTGLGNIAASTGGRSSVALAPPPAHSSASSRTSTTSISSVWRRCRQTRTGRRTQ